MSEDVLIADSWLTATISPLGAELRTLRDGGGANLLWDGDPAFWTGRAPLLFPIVGRLNGDRYRLDGQEYNLPQHGFARRRPFKLVKRDAARALFRLEADEATRAVYPFAFALDADYAIDESTLTMAITIRNTGDVPMPASFGYHPAFRWPLPYDRPRDAHYIRFEQPEPAALSALSADGLIVSDDRPTPVVGDTLRLTDDLFAHDALIWKTLNSRRLVYGADHEPQLDIAFPDTPWLGLWSKPGAGYVCIEPWAGSADPAGFDGEIWDKPGIIAIEPGGARKFRMIVTLTSRRTSFVERPGWPDLREAPF